MHYLLSKTSYIRGLQCPKALFFYRHYPQLRDPLSPSRQAVFARGHEVGKLAQQLFPGGKDATEGVGAKSSAAVERTQQLIEDGENVIYEAAFVHDHVLVLADILVRDGEDWKVYEVKSSLRLSKTYYRDAALQYFVISGTGLNVKDFFLVHLNGEYVRDGELELKRLFQTVSVLRAVKKELPVIAATVAEHKKILEATQIPYVKIGGHCFSPYECDFRGQCWKNVPPGNVFELAGISRQVQSELFEKGFVMPEQIPEDEQLPKMAMLHAHTRRTGKFFVDKTKLKNYLAGLQGDLLFLDIENFQPAIPRYDGTWPFMALTFAYSLHRKNKNGEISERIFLAEAGPDPREEFLKNFLADTAGEEIILSYDISAEKYSLNLLKKKFPQHGAEIDQRLARLRDLMLPFSEGWYHHPEMKGSFSLKNVLPALVPDLGYDHLKIQNGSHAMAVYEKMHDADDLFSAAEQREALEEYCRMDTLGMVKILEVLEKEAE